MNEMSVDKWWNEICSRGKHEKAREKPTQTSFRPPRNPHGVTETRTRDLSGGRRAPRGCTLIQNNKNKVNKDN